MGSTNIVPVNELLSPLGSAKHTNFPCPFSYVTIYYVRTNNKSRPRIQKIEWKFIVEVGDLGTGLQ